MFSQQQFSQQSGGLHTAILPYDQTDPVHSSTLGNILHETIKHEARTHGTVFDQDGFSNVMKAMTTGDVEVLFFAAAWDLCAPKIVGATINFRSLSLQRTGRKLETRNGIYSEDLCITPSQIRALVADRHPNSSFPPVGIGAHFILESMKYYVSEGLKGNIIPAKQTFEFLPSNEKFIKIQKQFGTILGTSGTSGLLRYNGIIATIESAATTSVEVLGSPLVDSKIDPYNFVVRWEGANTHHKINAGFTRTISTFKGTPVTQVQIISTGRFPDFATTKCALASILKAAEHEINFRKWGDHHEQEIIIGVNPPPMHIHVMNEPEILVGLYSLGLEPRTLGGNAMQTASLDLIKATASKNVVQPLKLVALNR